MTSPILFFGSAIGAALLTCWVFFTLIAWVAMTPDKSLVEVIVSQWHWVTSMRVW